MHHETALDGVNAMPLNALSVLAIHGLARQ
jgi:hypothetical protein